MRRILKERPQMTRTASLCMATFAAAMLSLTNAPSAAAADWVTACEKNGRITGWNPGRSFPRGRQCSGRVVTFASEQPGVKVANRMVSATEPGGGGFLFRPDPFAITVVWMTRELEDPEFRELEEAGAEEICGIFLTPAGWDIQLSTQLSFPDDFLVTEGSRHRIVFARPNSAATIFGPLELVSTDGRALRISDIKVTFDEDGCFGAAVFRYAKSVRAFYGGK